MINEQQFEEEKEEAENDFAFGGDDDQDLNILEANVELSYAMSSFDDSNDSLVPVSTSSSQNQQQFFNAPTVQVNSTMRTLDTVKKKKLFKNLYKKKCKKNLYI